MRDIASRFPENPLLTPADIRPSMDGIEVECLLNPGVFRFQGKIWLLLRVAERPKQKPGKTSFPILEENGHARILEFENSDPDIDLSDARFVVYKGAEYLTTLSHLRLVSSHDGIIFREEPSFLPIVGRGDLETYGVEDCRVVQIGDTYYLTYTAVSQHGVGVGLSTTTDWKNITQHGMILPPHNKDCAIFGELNHGKYYALHRPSSVQVGGNYIWIAESPDFIHWGNHRCIAHSRPNGWEDIRVGAGGAPIKTAEGWLEIYHAADRAHRYCLGALLLDLDEPWKVIARSEAPIMEPFAAYEQAGFFGNVVFTNGHLVSGDELTIYYGASDSVICGARFSVAEILQSLKKGTG